MLFRIISCSSRRLTWNTFPEHLHNQQPTKHFVYTSGKGKLVTNNRSCIKTADAGRNTNESLYCFLLCGFTQDRNSGATKLCLLYDMVLCSTRMEPLKVKLFCEKKGAVPALFYSAISSNMRWDFIIICITQIILHSNFFSFSPKSKIL